MAILGLALFGSRARRDGSAAADLDLLGVTTDRQPKFTVRNDVATSCYPHGLMVARAGLGDLFVLHVISEAKVIYEARPVFDEIRKAFKYNGDYAREIKLASDVGWLLVRYGDRLASPKGLNGRMAWATRTILIAKAAAKRQPMFGARQLAEFSGSPDVVTLIENKNHGQRDEKIAATFAEFLRAHGAPEPAVPGSLAEQKKIFEDDRNLAGVRLVDRLLQH